MDGRIERMEGVEDKERDGVSGRDGDKDEQDDEERRRVRRGMDECTDGDAVSSRQ